MTNPELPNRLARLRTLMKELKLDAVLVPRGDEHLGEYVPPSAERLAWLTGFTGSAGLAVILIDRAALFVDGRYTLQAGNQVSKGLYEIRHLMREPYADWLKANLKPGARVGYDPWLHAASAIAALDADLEAAGIACLALDRNPIDMVWSDRPAPPLAPILPHPVAYAGVDSAEKRMEIARALGDAAATVL